MSKSKIEWTEKTWNPTTGCDKISTGCKFCYAEVMSRRLMLMGQAKYKNNFQINTHQHELKTPFSWKKPVMVFVNSMSDLFHKDIPTEFIKLVFDTMNATPQHTYQVLTKRAERLLDLSPELNWTNNIWMGVSVENEEVNKRVSLLVNTNAKVKFLSCEPLLEDLTSLNIEKIDWVIVGGESGPKARPMNKEWVVNIKEKCEATSTPFFFKQWGGKNKKKAGRILDGKTYNEFPNS